MIDKHACSASCPCQKGRDLAIAEKVATRYREALELGKETFSPHGLKYHHWHGSLSITEMANAGKRGKKVRELRVIPDTHDDDIAIRIIQHAVKTTLSMTYDQAKAYLEKVMQEHAGANGRPIYNLTETSYRGVDVEPMGTKIELHNKFPDGSWLRITASPQDFHVTDSQVMSALDAEGRPKPAHGMHQDTSYWPAKKQDGTVFYTWLKSNMSVAGHMTGMDLRKVWEQLGVRWNSH
jgi:hypothetical protein